MNLPDVTEVLRAIAQALATAVEAIGAVIVSVAIALAVVRYLVALVGQARPFPPEGLRLVLA